jgi:pimeloyl-ACP methyl ester carboxylesterase
LKQRLARTRWPARETVADWSQGVRLDHAESLVDYWAREYDWRRFESRLNRFPQFMTTIDGLDIHFIHVRSKAPKSMPLLLTHGWPGSIVEFLKVIGPLTDPEAFGGNVDDAFDVVIPSLPGFGFSGKPTTTGWDPPRIARVFDGKTEGLTRDDILDNITLYWLTTTAVSSARIYWENKAAFFAPKHVAIPVAFSAFPDEVVQAPQSWVQRAYPRLIYYNKLDKGGHFAAWEEPALFTAELRAAFKPLRASMQARR